MSLTQSQFRILIVIFGGAAIISDFFDAFTFFVFKPLCTISILAFAVSYRNKALNAYSIQISAGLLFCLIGDCFLLFESYFIAGLAAFLIAHVVFLFAFIKRQGWKWRPEIALILLVVAGGVFALISKNLGSLFYPVLAYLIIILLMSWQGWAMSMNPKMEQSRTLGLATSLFLFSDAIIAINKFSYPFSLAGILVLTTYWCAIYLIARSATL